MNLVQKYGGEYLKDMSDIRKIASYVAQTRKQGEGLVIVTASMLEAASKMTDRVRTIGGEISQRDMDALFSAVEQQTAALMAASLTAAGAPAVSVADIRGRSLSSLEIEEGKHEIVMDAIDEAVKDGKIAVVAGFQGIGKFDIEDRLGRYGAGSTAVVIAAGLGCDCELYGNTKAIYTVEPDVDGKGKPVSEICYEEAMEVIHLGESDLERRAVELAKGLNVKIYVGPAFDEEKKRGTCIMSRNMIVQESAVSAISTSDDIVIYTIRGISTKGDILAELFEMLGDLGVNIDVISKQTCSDHSCAVSFSCGRDKIETIDKAFSQNHRFRDLDTARQQDICLISLVGVGMASHVGVAGRAFSVLADHDIRTYNITTSEISISASIDRDRKAEAVIALSEAFSI